MYSWLSHLKFIGWCNRNIWNFFFQTNFALFGCNLVLRYIFFFFLNNILQKTKIEFKILLSSKINSHLRRLNTYWLVNKCVVFNMLKQWRKFVYITVIVCSFSPCLSNEAQRGIKKKGVHKCKPIFIYWSLFYPMKRNFHLSFVSIKLYRHKRILSVKSRTEC